MKIQLIYLSVLILLSSCAYHTGVVTSSSMQGRKVQFVDMAIGYSKSTYFLGFGGLRQDALINDAKRCMYVSYKLCPGLSFENLTLDIKVTHVWPYKKCEVFAISDVVRGDSTLTDISFSNSYLNLLSGVNSRFNTDYSLNENILYYDQYSNYAKPGKIIKLESRRVSVFYIDSKATFHIQNVLCENIFKILDVETLSSKVKFNLNQPVTCKSNVGGQLVDVAGTIVGLNKDYALLRVAPTTFVKAQYSKLKTL